MPTYPDLPSSYGTDPKPLVKPLVDRAADNSARIWVSGDNKSKIPEQHPGLTADQKATLDAFYAANKSAIDISYTNKADGITRTVFFAGPPEYKREPGNYWTAFVPLEEV